MTSTGTTAETYHLKRDLGVVGLTLVSLGSIIGSGWLLGALNGAEAAGPASLISWVLGGAMLAALALVHAELGTAYPVAGGTARFPNFAFGTLTGFTAGWAAYLQAVTLAPIEVEASLQYLNNIDWVKNDIGLVHSNDTLTPWGFFFASLLMIVFTLVNIVGVKFLSDSNSLTVIWKFTVPVLTVIVLVSLKFHGSNFTAGGGFMPFGMHGVFAALPAGLIFAMQGFEQCIQLGGEARDPQKDISRAVILAMLIGTTLYICLEIAFIGSLDPNQLVHGWGNPIGAGDFGPYATLATAAGAAWLASVLYVDAFISPAGTGLLYMGTSARLSYALGRERTVPRKLASVTKRGVPVYSILLAFLIGEFAFLPFPSWQSLVGLVTEATAVMYAFAPVSLTALRHRDPDRSRPYHLPAPAVLSPVAFICANMIIYFSTFEANWKIVTAIAFGLVLFGVTWSLTSAEKRPDIDFHGWLWVPLWLGGMTVIGYFGRYGGKSSHTIPEWFDLGVVAVFSLLIFYFAVTLAVDEDEVQRLVDAEEEELANQDDLKTA